MDFIGDLMYDHPGWTILVVILIIVGLTGAVVILDSNEHDRACTGLLQLARTPRDTLDVRLRCDITDHHSSSTTFVPIVVPR